MKTTVKKAAKKELESTITNKFMQVITDLGHDADKLKKEIKKVSKSVAKKIAEKYDSAKEAATDKVTAQPVKKNKKSDGAAKKDGTVEGNLLATPSNIGKKANKTPASKVEATTEAVDQVITKTPAIKKVPPAKKNLAANAAKPAVAKQPKIAK